MIAAVLRQQQEGLELRADFVRARHLGSHCREETGEFGDLVCGSRRQSVLIRLRELQRQRHALTELVHEWLQFFQPIRDRRGCFLDSRPRGRFQFGGRRGVPGQSKLSRLQLEPRLRETMRQDESDQALLLLIALG